MLLGNKYKYLKDYEKYAYFSYYILGYYFPSRGYKFYQKLAEEAVANLQSSRFKNTYNSISLLTYLRKFVLYMT